MKKRDLNLKSKLVNTIMRSGNKGTGEKMIIKSIKLLQKSTNKKHVNLIKLAIINSTPTFRVTQQAKKRGKRKSIVEVPTFINSDILRVTNSLKLITTNSKRRGNSFYKNMSNEILEASSFKGKSIEKKTELQKSVLINKKILFKFRW